MLNRLAECSTNRIRKFFFGLIAGLGWQMQNGHHMAGLSLQLAPDWKTYWRAPGEAGIPPLFDWSGSTNVQSVRVHWPSPVVFHLNGMQTIGYHDGQFGGGRLRA